MLFDDNLDGSEEYLAGDDHLKKENHETVVETCPLGYRIGGNGITIAWDSAIELGNWEELNGADIAINIRTIIRNAKNAYNGINSDYQPKLAERVEEDIMLIKQYFSDVHDANVTIYSVNYNRLKVSKLPNFRIPKTDKQKAEAKVFDDVLLKVKHLVDQNYQDKIYLGAGYIVSHIIYDLARANSNIKLIETHTGAIKSRSELNSKLNLTPEETMVVPFSMVTYLLYGDKQLLNKNTKVTKTLFNVLTAGNITPLSTEMRLSFVVQQRDPLLFKFLRNLTNG